jgi:hypothetical protein
MHKGRIKAVHHSGFLISIPYHSMMIRTVHKQHPQDTRPSSSTISYMFEAQTSCVQLQTPPSSTHLIEQYETPHPESSFYCWGCTACFIPSYFLVRHPST